MTTSGTTINRFCSSGLQAVASIAHSIVHDKVACGVGGGVDSISLVQPKLVKGAIPERQLLKTYPALWMPMIQTVYIFVFVCMCVLCTYVYGFTLVMIAIESLTKFP